MTDRGRDQSGMQPVRTVIVDDEPEAREGLRRLVEARDGHEVVATCSGGHEAVEFLREERADLLLLDVQMPEMDGFEVVATLDPDERPVVIFVTAYDSYALAAFQVHALDYVVKPFSEERLDEALERGRERVALLRVGRLSQRLASLLDEAVFESSLGAEDESEHDRDSADRSGGPVRRIMVRNHRGVHFVPIEEIDRISAADYYARIHTSERTFLLRQSLTALEEALPADLFARTHRSAIVNLRRVRSIEESDEGLEAVLADGSRAPVARSRKAEIVEAVRAWS